MSQSDVKPPPSYRGLLALVIILGVLIVFGVVALIAGIAFRTGTRPAAGTAYAANVLAPGERIESTQLDGNRILLRLSGPNGDELVVLDAGSGRVIGRIAINSRP
jgi:hypothetical protein